MSTIYIERSFGPTAAPTRRARGLFERYWNMFREWRKRDRLRASLYGLSDRELQDIGTTRGEIEHVARSRSDVRAGRPA